MTLDFYFKENKSDIFLCSVFSLLPKISKQQLQQTKDRFQAFLNGETQIVADEAFINAVQSYSEVVRHGSPLKTTY